MIEKKNPLLRFLTYFIIIAGAITTIFPLVWMVSTSLKTEGNVFKIPPQIIPKPIIFTNYAKAVAEIPYLRYFLNSLYLALIKMGGEVFVSLFVAYGFARFQFKGRNVFFIIMLLTLMIPGEITIIPAYIMYSWLHLIDTYFPIGWAAYIGGNVTFIFFLRMFLSTIPKELDESAYIDGANSFQILVKIIAPLTKPALVVIGIWSFMGSWNDLLGPLLYLNSYEKFTIQLGLAQFNSLKEINWGALMSASVISLIPPILIFFIGQKNLLEGIKITGIK